MSACGVLKVFLYMIGLQYSALFGSFSLSVLGVRFLIYVLTKNKATQSVNKYLNDVGVHAKKSSTPTAGGVAILFSILVTSIACLSVVKINNLTLVPIICLFVGLGFGLIGLCDDLVKILQHNYRGVKAKTRLLAEIIIASLAMFAIDYTTNTSSTINFFCWQISIWPPLYFAFRIFVVVGCANAVNLTDGLDGLVSIPLALIFAFFVILTIHSPISLIGICSIGSLLGFLVFNIKPASIFMGDTGSLSLGAICGLLFCSIKAEIALSIVGLLLVVETMSVILQISSIKIRGKKIFLFTPLHHHFEKLGWSEWKVAWYFWAFATLCFCIALILHLFGLLIAHIV